MGFCSRRPPICAAKLQAQRVVHVPDLLSLVVHDFESGKHLREINLRAAGVVARRLRDDAHCGVKLPGLARMALELEQARLPPAAGEH